MNVIDKRFTEVRFSDIRIGECFTLRQDHDDIFIRISDDETLLSSNAVLLTSGETECFNPNELVIRIRNVELTIS
jgi:hypothetical protein